jgi:hypothetical protein
MAAAAFSAASGLHGVAEQGHDRPFVPRAEKPRPRCLSVGGNRVDEVDHAFFLRGGRQLTRCFVDRNGIVDVPENREEVHSREVAQCRHEDEAADAERGPSGYPSSPPKILDTAPITWSPAHMGIIETASIVPDIRPAR